MLLTWKWHDKVIAFFFLADIKFTAAHAYQLKDEWECSWIKGLMQTKRNGIMVECAFYSPFLFYVHILRQMTTTQTQTQSDSLAIHRVCVPWLYSFSVFFSRLVADTLKPSVAMQQNEYLSIYCTVFVVVVAGAVVQLWTLSWIWTMFTK